MKKAQMVSITTKLHLTFQNCTLSSPVGFYQLLLIEISFCWRTPFPILYLAHVYHLRANGCFVSQYNNWPCEQGAETMEGKYLVALPKF